MELETFKEKVIPLRRKLLAYTSKLAGGQVEEEDIVQDVFLKLWSMRERLDGYDSVEALALTITKNKVFDELKRCRNESLESIERSDLGGIFATSDPETIAEQKDMVSHVKRLIGALPGLQQTIIRMKDVEGYELSEIATLTDTQIEAVRVNLSRARKRIREQLIWLNNITQKQTTWN
jgi:RNA polymerase sigma-70 factor (ECF subfamily)